MKVGKYVIIIVCIVIIITVFAIFFFRPSDKKNAYVNENILIMIKSQDYKQSTLQNRKKVARQLLLKLWVRGYIRYFTFQEANSLFSFVFCDGTIGGISLSEFEPMFN